MLYCPEVNARNVDMEAFHDYKTQPFPHKGNKTYPLMSSVYVYDEWSTPQHFLCFCLCLAVNKSKSFIVFLCISVTSDTKINLTEML